MKRLVLVLAACGGGQPAPTHTPQPPPAHADAAPVAQADHPTLPECDALLDHAVALASGSAKLTEEERTKVHAQLHDELASSCGAMPRDHYTCAMAATTLGDLAACDQRTPSSSTSNSSVAPGGITPAAPRSP